MKRRCLLLVPNSWHLGPAGVDDDTKNFVPFSIKNW